MGTSGLSASSVRWCNSRRRRGSQSRRPSMFSFPLPSSTHADVAEHAVAVLNALQGDWREALCHMDLYRAEYPKSCAKDSARAVSPAMANASAASTSTP